MATEVMTESATTVTDASTATEASTEDVDVPGVTGPEDLVEDELLVEEVSIDGMCGVY